jgi:pyridoxal phosphate enzyme (YggS family)
MESLADRVANVRDRMAKSLATAGRAPGEVTLVAVSKNHPVEKVREAMGCGLNVFGENRVQEGLGKMEAVSASAEWHLIGPLQSNKVRKAVGRFALLHGIDTLERILQIERAAAALGEAAKILLEVNISGEPTKHGFAPRDMAAALEHSLELPFVRVEGLMTMAPFDCPGEAARPFFEGLRKLRDRLQEATGAVLPILSMGMSGDYEQAILEGATHIRIGTTIFGSR